MPKCMRVWPSLGATDSVGAATWPTHRRGLHRSGGASDRVSTAEPQSVAGRLKKAYAALMTMASGAVTSAERVRQCQAEAQAVLDKEPENPYASDVAASCNDFAADSAQSRGEDPEPLLRKALSLLEPAMRRNPHFLWGLNDLANTYLQFAAYLQLRGNSAATEFVEKALNNITLAISLDPTYLFALANGQVARSRLISLAGSDQEIRGLLTQADEAWARCKKENNQFQPCAINYLVVYSRAAERAYLSRADRSLA